MNLVAVRHQQTFTHGHSRPMLIVAEEPVEGWRREIVLKLAPDVQSGRNGLAIEAICAGLAARLGLNAAQGWTVDIHAEFASGVPDADARRRLGASLGQQFGSTFHAGQYHVPLADDSLPASLIDKAAAVLLFDAMIGNDDRHRLKPNCLLRGDDIVLIDHERALPGLRAELRPAAWETGGLEAIRNHVFFSGLRGELPDFAEAARAWQPVTPSVVSELVAGVPPEWLDDMNRTRATHFVVEMVANVNRVSTLLTEILR
jgi:hypothetical protein